MNVKRITLVLLSAILFTMLIVPAPAYARTYDLSDTDMSISIDDTEWYVFTRDNIDNNPELEEVGVSVEQMREVFNINDAYLDAFVIYTGGGFLELIVVKKEGNFGVANLSSYSDEDVMELAEEVSGLQEIEDYSVYKKNGYKFVKLETVSTASDNITYNLCEYFTVVNKDIYSFKFQSVSQFDEEDYRRIEEIVGSIRFDVDNSLKEDVKRSVSVGKVALWAIVGAIGGGAIGGIIGFAVDKKRKAAKKASEGSVSQLNGAPYAAPDGLVKPEGYVEPDGFVRPEGYLESDGCVAPDDYKKE